MLGSRSLRKGGCGGAVFCLCRNLRGDNNPTLIAREMARWSAFLPASTSALAKGTSWTMFSARVAPPWWGGSQAVNDCGEQGERPHLWQPRETSWNHQSDKIHHGLCTAILNQVGSSCIPSPVLQILKFLSWRYVHEPSAGNNRLSVVWFSFSIKITYDKGPVLLGLGIPLQGRHVTELALQWGAQQPPDSEGCSTILPNKQGLVLERAWG